MVRSEIKLELMGADIIAMPYNIKVSMESFKETVGEISNGVELPVILGCTELLVLVENLHAWG